MKNRKSEKELKKELKDKSKEPESFSPETVKGPQKDKHVNQYGDQDKNPKA